MIGLAAAFAAVAAAAAVVIVAASFTVYALAKPYVGEAGASAVVAGVFAMVAAVVAWIATRKVVPPRTRRAHATAEQPIADRLIEVARERPIVALAAAGVAAATAAVVLVRNPAVITAVISAFVAGKASKSGK